MCIKLMQHLHQFDTSKIATIQTKIDIISAWFWYWKFRSVKYINVGHPRSYITLFGTFTRIIVFLFCNVACDMYIFTEWYMFQGLISTVAILVIAMMLWSLRWIKSVTQLHFHDQYQTDTKLRFNHFQRRIPLAINISQKMEANKQAIKWQGNNNSTFQWHQTDMQNESICYQALDS